MPASWDEVGELLGHADAEVIRQVVETGAEIDEIGTALSDLENRRRSGESQLPASQRVAELRRILEPLYEDRDEGTFSVIGVPI